MLGPEAYRRSRPEWSRLGWEWKEPMHLNAVYRLGTKLLSTVQRCPELREPKFRPEIPNATRLFSCHEGRPFALHCICILPFQFSRPLMMCCQSLVIFVRLLSKPQLRYWLLVIAGGAFPCHFPDFPYGPTSWRPPLLLRCQLLRLLVSSDSRSRVCTCTFVVCQPLV